MQTSDYSDTTLPEKGTTPLIKASMIGERRLTSRMFLVITAGSTLLFCCILVGINIYFDVFGLFRDAQGRSLPVYHNERTSKYLLSYHYIPENYRGILIGTSLSANIAMGDKSHPFFNASIMGANVAELSPVLKKCIDGGIKRVVFCMSPYMLKNAEAKEVELNDKLFYSALGSKNLLETYVVAGIRKFDLLPGRYPKGQIDEHGVNRFESLFNSEDVRQKIETVLAKEKNEAFVLNEKAVQELKKILRSLEENAVSYTFYFHPVPKEFYRGKERHYRDFENEIRKIITDERALIDFNDAKYDWFTSDYANYIDHGHLSPKGSQMLADLLNEHLAESVSRDEILTNVTTNHLPKRGIKSSKNSENED